MGISFIVGFLLGGILITILFRTFLVGTIRVDHSDPFDGPYLFLELSRDIRQVTNKKYVMLRVDVKDYISQD